MIGQQAWYDQPRINGVSERIEGTIVSLDGDKAEIQPFGCTAYTKTVRLEDKGAKWDLDRSVYQAANIEGEVA